MEKVEKAETKKDVVIEEVVNQEKTKKEMIFIGVECNRKRSLYPEGQDYHY